MGWRNPHLCGQPKKDGSPCGWVVTESPCPFHLTPEEEAAARRREEEAAEKRRVRLAEDRAAHRAGLVRILSVTCPHCGVRAATLCRNPQGRPQRGLHKARRRLADCDFPKDFALESYVHGRPPAVPPPLDSDPRAVLDDPLVDRTDEMSRAYQERQRAEAAHRLRAAQRTAWLAAAPRDEAVEAVSCPECSAARGSPCTGWARRFSRAHTGRVDVAMAADAR